MILNSIAIALIVWALQANGFWPSPPPTAGVGDTALAAGCSTDEECGCTDDCLD